jgi:hypothetical protein
MLQQYAELQLILQFFVFVASHSIGTHRNTAGWNGWGEGTRECSRRHAPVDGLPCHLVTVYDLKSMTCLIIWIISRSALRHTWQFHNCKPASTKIDLLNQTRPVETSVCRRQCQHNLVCMRATWISLHRIMNEHGYVQVSVQVYLRVSLYNIYNKKYTVIILKNLFKQYDSQPRLVSSHHLADFYATN